MARTPRSAIGATPRSSPGRSAATRRSSSSTTSEAGPWPAPASTTAACTPDEWRAQFLERPDARIECVGIAGAWSAVVESSDEFDRIHCVSDDAALPQLAARAHGRGRRLFWYTTRTPSMECEWTEGFV